MKLFFLRSFLILIILFGEHAYANCSGNFPNIITDICWECVFPIKIGNINITPGYDDGSEPDGSPICMCPNPALANAPTPGIKIQFWEPARMLDVTRAPFCLVNLSGIRLGNSSSLRDRGAAALPTGEGLDKSFYHVHWYVFPVFYVFELLMDFACVDKGQIDLLHLSEFDPFYSNDEFSLLQNPEAVLFGNIVAQAACAADCLKSSLSKEGGYDSMFWCAGCHGGIYPFTGSIPATVTSVQATELLVTKFIAKMHRYGLLYAYVGRGAECQKQFAPIIKKSMYRLQMLNPVPSTDRGCFPLGKSDFWHPRHNTREIMQGSNNYGYLIWRKRQCCLL